MMQPLATLVGMTKKFKIAEKQDNRDIKETNFSNTQVKTKTSLSSVIRTMTIQCFSKLFATSVSFSIKHLARN